MFVYGVGNHGGGATIEDIKATIRMREKPTLPSVIFSSTHGFFDEVLREKPELPVVRDELNFTFDGCYTTHADIKRYNRICERYLVDAEKFATIVGDFPKDDLKKAWEKVLFNQFHDILDGSAFHEAYYYSGLLAEEALKVARDLLEKSLKKIASNIKFAMQGIPIVVFNTLAWDRKDVVRVRIAKELIPENPTLIDLRGEKHHVQIDGDELMFIADVPSLGYSTYYLIKGKVDGTSENKEQMVLENEFLKVEIDKNSGAIKSIYDKRYGRFVTNAFRHEATRPEMSNLFQVLYEAPHDMSAWIIGPITHIDNLLTGAEVELVTHGPVMSKAISTIRYKNSKIIQEILLYKEMPRIDFVTKVDWREKSNAYTDAPMLKVSFSPILGSSVATFEIPFGSITRVADGREFPALRWIDLSDNEYGVSLLNDCKHGFDVSGNIMRMTILRTSCSPDPTPDQGFHELKYSLYPHAGDWRKALTFRAGCEINHPLEAVIIDRVANDANLPEEMSFLRIRPENMVLSCLKMAEDGDEIIIRVYDATGEGGILEVDFGFPVKEANEVDLVESKKSKIDLLNESLRVKVGPSEIKTISIKRV
jgi:alpha-mannosidase